MKTFIVEDSPVVLQNLASTLEELTPVDVVGSTADEAFAVRWLAEAGQDCQLVIIDVFLQRGSGLGVLRAIRHSGFAGKCVVLTNYATRDMRAACYSMGADCVFDKSDEIDELFAYCIRLAVADGGAADRALH